jgi:glucose-6-phosphate dehydrogenase assembly protein OpcA
MEKTMIHPEHDIDSDVATAAPFTVDSIERQIHDAWSELGARAEEAGAAAPLRTSILTLIVISSGEAETRRANDALERLVQVLPSRVIHVAFKDSTRDLEATVSAHCAITSTDQTNCYELVKVKAGPEHMRAIPSILTQLDIPDLTTFIWWVGSIDASSGQFRRLSGIANRIVVDSGSFDRPLQDLAELRSYLVENEDTLAGTDLAWSRLLSMRELAAQSFDHPDALDMLSHFSRLELAYNPAALTDALLMTGWLTSRLELEPVAAARSEHEFRLTTRYPDGKRVEFRLSPATARGKGLRSVRILAQTPAGTSRVTIRRTEQERATVNIDMTGLPRQQRTVHCADGSDDQMLGMELLQFSRDTIYEHALEHAVLFAALLQHEENAT